MEFCIGQDGVARARGGGGIVLGADRNQLRHFHAETLGRAGEDGLSESEPGDGAGASHVVEATPVLWRAKAASQHTRDDRMSGAGQLDRGGWCTNLVVDN